MVTVEKVCLFKLICTVYMNIWGFYSIGPDHAAESIEGRKLALLCFILKWPVVLIKGANHEIITLILFSSGPALVTVEGDARARHHETGAVRAHDPGRGGGGIAADPALAAEDIVTPTSRAQNTSKCIPKTVSPFSNKLMLFTCMVTHFVLCLYIKAHVFTRI